MAPLHEKRCFNAIPYLQLLEDDTHVMLDRFLAQVKRFANFLVAHPHSHKIKDIALAHGQMV